MRCDDDIHARRRARGRALRRALVRAGSDTAELLALSRAQHERVAALLHKLDEIARLLGGAAAAALLVLLAGISPARADVKQPNGQPVPNPVIGCYAGQPGGLGAIFACACTQPNTCNIGAPCPGGSTSCDPGTKGTCETTIWHSVNDNTCIPSNLSGLHPAKDAMVKPETFRPVCGLSFTLVARGGALFKNVFGWYNVDASGKKPEAKDLHPLIQCGTPNGTTIPFNLLAEPAYKGGDIAFFIATPESPTQKGACAKGDCCATVARATSGEGFVYTSQPLFNPDNKGPGLSYIHLLIYGSKLDPFKYYFAWEDTFDGTSNDFSDFVTAVAGISCSGGGLKCDTGKPGVCGLGVTKCVTDGQTSCEQSNQPSAEVCDGLDNDCNGQVDDGASCSAGRKCYQGVCVPDCKTSQEFACQIGFDCDAQLGLCVDSACKGVVCKAGQICRGGTCGNGCDGAVCPRGQVCQGGICVDLCAGRSCQQHEICKLGVCIPNCLGCGGLTCAGGLACHKMTGDCYDPSCSPECAPPTICKAGKCVDPCDGVVCPGGVACLAGSCPPAGIGKGQPSTPGADGPAPWSPPDGGPGRTESGAPKQGFSDDGGCGCTVAERAASTAGPLGLLLLLGLTPLRRRRRR